MQAKLGAVLSRHKFQRFSDVLAVEAMDRALPHAASETAEQEIPAHAQVAAPHSRGNS
jgi:hypothetical protein